MKQTIQWKNKSIQIDIGLILILILFGMTSCFALYNSFNLIKFGSGSSYLYRQLFWFIVGFVAMFFLSILQNKKIYSYMDMAYKILMLCLIYLFFSRLLFNLVGITLPFASEVNGAISWFQLPLIGSFQPSEFMKIVLVIICADVINEHNLNRSVITFTNDIELFKKILQWAGPPLLLILLQPDTGVCLIIILSLVVMLMCSGIKKQWILIGGGLLLFTLIVFFYLFFFQYDLLTNFIQGYKLNRITAWLYPEENMATTGLQLYSALLSLGAGGLTGFGLQPDVLAIPEAQTDFIFAVIGQSFGLIGTTTVLAVCLLLDLYILRIAINTNIMTEKYLISGVLGFMIYQQIQNMGMITGLLPITGITLPLISYGGSSILSYFIVFGMIMNISSHAKKYADFIYS